MKTTDQNQMDLLLRALGRDASARSPLASPPQSGQEIGAHLDANELNCYAEGIVSGAERARYNKHLADCDTCRRIVTGLVPAAAVTRRREVAEQNLGWNLREKLAALFAPSVLRFAVPALALTAIIAIAIVALRRQEQTNFVAQNQTQTSPAISGGGENQKSTAENVPQSAMSPAQPSSAESKEKNLSRSEGTDAIQPPAAAPNTSPTTDQAAKDRVQPGQATGVAESQPTFATEPTEAAAPPPPPRPALADASKTAEARKLEEDAEQKRRRDLNYSQARDENEVARVGPSKGGPSRNNSQNVGGLSSVVSRTANKDEKAAGSTVETRRVSGRLFRREGNAWIDSDYAAGRARVNVKRGSEQFRALIADEPSLRPIAEQLGGEVIVVWKGTAYRIH